MAQCESDVGDDSVRRRLLRTGARTDGHRAPRKLRRRLRHHRTPHVLVYLRRMEWA
jgi:hypothetical protein